jgi:hypothetical protein
MPQDFILIDHGCLLVLVHTNILAGEWIADHLPADAPRWGGGVAIEPRCIEPILVGLEDDGFTWRAM